MRPRCGVLKLINNWVFRRDLFLSIPNDIYILLSQWAHRIHLDNMDLSIENIVKKRNRQNDCQYIHDEKRFLKSWQKHLYTRFANSIYTMSKQYHVPVGYSTENCNAMKTRPWFTHDSNIHR